MSTMSTKQVAASVRKALDRFAGRGGSLRWSNGTEITLPAGLGFTVRATTKGVNITIEDRGWVDHVTGGDREKIGEHKGDEAAIRAEVDKVRSLYTPPLPGETKWGMIIISATHIGTRREGSRISDSDHYDPPLYCADCRTEILRGERRHEIAGRTPGRVDTLCEPCNTKFMNEGLAAS